MRRVMSVDIKRPHAPRTPRKIRINPPAEPSPEAMRNSSRQQTNSGNSNGSPEATRSTGFAVSNRDLASAKEASRRMDILTNAISPRKLPEDRFNSIVKRLNYACTPNGTSTTNGTNSTSGTRSREEQSVAGASDVSRPVSKKQPRKLSVNHSAERTNGVDVNGG